MVVKYQLIVLDPLKPFFWVIVPKRARAGKYAIHDAAEAPHIATKTIWLSKNDLGRHEAIRANHKVALLAVAAQFNRDAEVGDVCDRFWALAI